MGTKVPGYERSLGTKVPRNFRSPGTKVPENERARELKFQGTFGPRERKFPGTKSPGNLGNESSHRDLSFLGTKGLGYEKSNSTGLTLCIAGERIFLHRASPSPVPIYPIWLYTGLALCIASFFLKSYFIMLQIGKPAFLGPHITHAPALLHPYFCPAFYRCHTRRPAGPHFTKCHLARPSKCDDST